MQPAPPQFTVTHDAWQKLAQECAQGAIYDSNERQPHSTCLPGTRVELLRSLKELADDGKRKIVWISGESGSGKSTVAHTLADELRVEGKLVGTFFFSRKHTKRSTFDYVLLTLAYQLGLQHPRAKEIIAKAISDDPALLSPEKSRHDLLERLIIEPLRELDLIWEGNSGVSIVLDALDEGTASGTLHISPFISLLTRLIKDTSLPIHNVIISSRPWPQISSVMRNPSVSTLMKILQVEDFDSREDVTHFFQHAFGQIYDNRLVSFLHHKPWPSESDLLMLSERAHGRFIFAATIVRLIDQERPHNRLQMVCNMLSGNTGSMVGDINQLYSSIINETEPTTRAKGLEYLSFIINLAEPLPLAGLDQLFADHVHSYLVPFSALISVPTLGSPELVQIFHTSFRDFLQTKEQDEITSIHRRLASSCFHTMRVLLKRDICGLEDPSLLHDEIPDFAQKRDSIPRALRYACLYWLHHLQLAPPDDDVQEHLLDFLRQRILFAIEAYAVLGQLGHGVAVLREARKLVSAWPDVSFVLKDEAVALLYDSWRLTLDFFEPISVSALHVYESAFPCSPAKSKIRHVYSHYLEGGAAFIFEEGLDNEWDCITSIIDMKTNLFKAALSPDASQIAAFTPDSVHVWQTLTGMLVASLAVGGLPTFGDITHNGSLVVFQLLDRISHYIWRPSDSALVSFPSCGPSDESFGTAWFHVAVSSDGGRLACFWGNNEDCVLAIYTYDMDALEQLSCETFHLNPPQPPLLSRRKIRYPTSTDARSLQLEFSLQGDCLVVHFAGCILVFDPVDNRLLSWTECNDAGSQCTSNILVLGPDDQQIFHVSHQAHVGNISRFSFVNATKPSGGISTLWSKNLSSSTSKNSHSHQLPIPSARSTAPSKLCKVKRIKSGDKRERLGPQPKSIIYAGELIGIQLGDSTAGFCNGRRTSWMPQNKECFGVICKDSHIQLVDVVQAALQPSSDTAKTNLHPEPGYEMVARSVREDMTAYKSVISDKLLVLDSKTSGYAYRWEFEAGTIDALEQAQFTPKSTYFAVAFRDNSSTKVTQFQVWDLRLRTRVGIQYPQSCNPTLEAPLEIRFSADDSMLALVQPSDTGDSIVYYSLEGNILHEVTSFSPPQQMMYRFGGRSIASVTRDAICFWVPQATSEDVHFPCLYQWDKATSTIKDLGCVLHFDWLLPPSMSPSLNRIYYRAYGGSSVMRLGTSLPPKQNILAGDTQDGPYQVVEDHGHDSFYDELSWSDLCMTTDGWFQKGRRRICWLPTRYRPPFWSQESKHLKLVTEGNKVTILGLENDRCITIRLLHTNVEYFD